MRGKIILASLAILGIIGLFVVSNIEPPEREDVIFHARLADPTLYTDDVFAESFEAAAGRYTLYFVLSGGSPKQMTVDISGEDTAFAETFTLVQIPTDIEDYYKWEYRGEKRFDLPNNDTLDIVIDPHGDIIGPVSVFILDVDKMDAN